jgi:DNA primase
MPLRYGRPVAPISQTQYTRFAPEELYCHTTQGRGAERPNSPSLEVRCVTGGGWDLDEIRSRADIVEIISPHVRLRRSGGRLTGLCPFHEERTPSFTVDPEKGLWHCFGCKAGGDLFRFVEMVEKVSFAEAVEMLARRLGLPPRHREDASKQRANERLLSIHEQAADLFRACLRGKAGRHAREYLDERGLSERTVEQFGLGYAPDSWDALTGKMKERGFAPEELVRAGLAVARDGRSYDRFRNRLIFPIHDVAGRVIAFGGRALADDQQPKYLNSPESPLFRKGRVLWAFHRARRAMGDVGRGIVVEGYMDAIACHDIGLAETVATMGTALTPDHVDLLRRRADRIVLAFDSDSAGMAAALRARELYRRAGIAVHVATMPEGADPDNVIRSQGAEAFQASVDDAVPIVEWELARILARAHGRPERERMAAMREAVAALARVAAGVEREYYIRWLAQRWASDSPDRSRAVETAVRDEIAQWSAREPGKSHRREELRREGDSAREESVRTQAGSRHFKTLLAALVQHHELAEQYVPMLEPGDFPTEQHREVWRAVSELVGRGEPVDLKVLSDRVGPEAREIVAEVALDKRLLDDVETNVAGGVQRLIAARLTRQAQALKERLEKATTTEEQQVIQRELLEVGRRRSELIGRTTVDDG